MSKGKIIFVITFITITGFYYNYKYLCSYPSAIHAWAQADRYALALGFVDNNLNFFKPQTLIYNHQFPDKWEKAGEQRITAVDFPVHDFIPAVIMKISGSKSPLIFRLYILLFSLAGLYFLFRLAFFITESFYKSFLVCAFAATSPVFVYYQANFLPSIPCLSGVIIGLFFYLKYVRQNQLKVLAISLLFLTLAALSRLTYIIPLFAIIGVEFLRLLKYNGKLRLVHLLFLLPIALVLLYQLYNEFLRERYGSDFLNYLLPPKDLNNFYKLIKITINRWGFQYFSIYHYLTILLIIPTLAVLLITKRNKVNAEVKLVTCYVAILLIAYSIFGFAMLRQFPDHDYYFLDTFFLPIMLLLVIGLAYIRAPKNRIQKYVTGLVCFLIISFLLYQPLKSQKERYGQVFWNKTIATMENFKDADIFLDSAGMSKDARILVIDGVAPNLPFVLMKRTGYVIMFPEKENITQAMQWKYDYIVLQDEYVFNELNYIFPEFVGRLHRISGNGKISVYTLAQQEKEDPLALIKNSASKPLYSSIVDFEGDIPGEWTNFKLSDSISYSGSRAGYLSPENEFGLTFSTTNLSALKTKSTEVFITFQCFRQKIQGCLLVTKINSNNKHIHYRELDLRELPCTEKGWQAVKLMFKLPKVEANDFEFSVYFWNPLRSEIYYDNFLIEVY